MGGVGCAADAGVRDCLTGAAGQNGSSGSQNPGRALALGWVFGFLGSLLGLLASIHFDLPAAPTILVALSSLLVVLGVALNFRAGVRSA